MRDPNVRAALYAQEQRTAAADQEYQRQVERLRELRRQHGIDPTARVSLDTPHGTHVELLLPDETWRDNAELDDPHARLAWGENALLTINGTPMHVEAWAVEEVNDIQEHLEAPEDLAKLHAAVHGDGPFRTTTINDRDYVLVLSPYC